ncbi:unnamed protein product [Somion occarium]|uniref:Uncharacterized protein n=1 Tax=Somion occarium TaxID=3059160 RepID=A0ABP1DLF6_9APHY
MVAPVGLRGLATAKGLMDVAQEIKIDHDNIPVSYEEKLVANTLIREISIHGDAEEIYVYNDYQKLGLHDAAMHSKEDHAEVKKLIFRDEHIAASHEHHDDIMADSVNAFFAHGQEEETTRHPTLREKLSPEDNDKLARAFLKAREMVPTRPHPLAPQTDGTLQKAMGVYGHV